MTDGVLHLSHDDVVDLAPLHVLGALEPGEAAAVRAHVATCAIGHPELEELGSVVPALWETVDQVEPPAELKARVLAAAAEAVPVAAPPRVDRRAPTPTAARDADATEPRRLTSVGPADEAEFRPTVLSRSVDWAFRIAAVLAIVALLGWNLALQRDLNQADDYRNRVAAVLQLGSQAGSSVAFLAPQAGQAASGIAAVAADGHTELAMSRLAPTTGSAVYAAWAIAAPDAAPIPIGEFAVSGNGAGNLATTVPGAAPGVTLAVTREPNPGATKPTTPIVAAGTTRAPTA